jgi:hypothetical protein
LKLKDFECEGSNAAAESGFGTPRWQLETKLPQSQTDAKGVDGRAIGDGFAPVHESGYGTNRTSCDVRSGVQLHHRNRPGESTVGLFRPTSVLSQAKSVDVNFPQGERAAKRESRDCQSGIGRKDNGNKQSDALH